MLRCSNIGQPRDTACDASRSPQKLPGARLYMSLEKRPDGLESPLRRKLLLGTAAASVASLLPPRAWADAFPTAQVNTTGLAVTDTDVTVGILHSVTGTMAISETGSVEAEQLAIDQINAAGRRARPQDQVHPGGRRQRLADLRREGQEAAGQRQVRVACSAAGPRPRARPCCRCSSRTTACSTTRPSTKASSSRRT